MVIDDKSGWYQRWENNGWRLVSDRVMKRVDQDPVVYESTLKKELFSHNKVKLDRGFNIVPGGAGWEMQLQA